MLQNRYNLNGTDKQLYKTNSGLERNDTMYKSFSEIPAIMTFSEARAVLKIGRNKMLYLIHSGELAAFRIGNRYRITRANLLEYIEGL